ncbi:complement C3-like, partial [Saccoglossus kowalevskii]
MYDSGKQEAALVLRTYSVEIEPPKHILPKTTSIEGKVKATYVHGKPVSGHLFMKFSVDQGHGNLVDVSTLHGIVSDGVAGFTVSIDKFEKTLGVDWFEENEEKRLLIEASVTEEATGSIENTTDNTAVFARSPYKIIFNQTVKYFKPGLPYDLKLAVTHVDNRPAGDIPVIMKVQAIDEKGVTIDLNNEKSAAKHAISNAFGDVYLTIDVPQHTKTVTINVRTNKPDILPEENKEETFTSHPYESSSRGYLAVREGRRGSLPFR